MLLVSLDLFVVTQVVIVLIDIQEVIQKHFRKLSFSIVQFRAQKA